MKGALALYLAWYLLMPTDGRVMLWRDLLTSGSYESVFMRSQSSNTMTLMQKRFWRDSVGNLP